MLTSWARVLNLIVPGIGMVLVGNPVQGLIIGLCVAVLVNLALWAVLIIPADFERVEQGTLIGVAAGAYVGAQLRLAFVTQRQRRAGRQDRRREVLELVRQRLRARDFAGAREALAALPDPLADDLLTALRRAQIFTGLGDEPRARAAWEQVRRLDHQRLYKSEVRAVLGDSRR